MGWERAREKFEQLVTARIEPPLVTLLVETVEALHELETHDLTTLLACARDETKGAKR
jgi:hypothetical protein